MSELNAAGYQAVQNLIINAGWYIELVDELDAPVFRRQLTSGKWTDNGQSITATEVITGEDLDISLPQTFAGGVLYAGAEGGDALTEVEAFSQTTLEVEADSLTVNFTLEVPQIVE
jgi:hypothetical protein